MKLFLTVILILFFSISQTVHALMPPHITKTIPKNGEILKGDTLTVYGYSLEYAKFEELKIINLNTQKSVPFEKELKCKWEGDPQGPMGSMQMPCILKIKLKNIQPNQQYEFDFLKEKIQFKSTAVE